MRIVCLHFKSCELPDSPGSQVGSRKRLIDGVLVTVKRYASAHLTCVFTVVKKDAVRGGSSYHPLSFTIQPILCGMVRRRTTVANPASNYVFALPHTAVEDRVEVLLVKRHLVQTLQEGRAHQGIIPNWAGQWGLIAARPLVSQSLEETVQGAVLAQTGIDLSDPASAARYQIVGAEPHTLTDTDNKPVPILFLTFLPEGLRAFAADTVEHLASGKVRDGAIDTLEIKPVSHALTLIEPCAPPPEGWAGFLGINRPRGHKHVPLGSGNTALARQLAERSAMAPSAARLAVQTLATCSGVQDHGMPQAPSEGVTLTELEIVGARLHRSGLWYQTYTLGQAVHIRAVTYPSLTDAVPIEWQGGEPDPSGRPDWRALPLDRLSAPGSPFQVRATLGGKALEARIAVVPNLIGVEVTRPHTLGRRMGGSDTPAPDMVWLRAVVSPATEEAFLHLNWYGGTVDPSHPFDRRLVSFQDIATDGKGIAVEANVGLQ